MLFRQVVATTANECEECGWVTKQRRTYRTYSESKYLLQRTQRKDGDQCYWKTKVDGNFRNAVASSSQPRNQLEKKGGENDKMPRRVWEAMETRTGEVRMVETKRRGG